MVSFLLQAFRILAQGHPYPVVLVQTHPVRPSPESVRPQPIVVVVVVRVGTVLKGGEEFEAASAVSVGIFQRGAMLPCIECVYSNHVCGQSQRLLRRFLCLDNPEIV